MDLEPIKKRYEALYPHLDGRLRRLFAAAEAMILGRGGISTVSKPTGISRNAIARGIEEITTQSSLVKKEIRQKGGGRKHAIDKIRH